MVFKIISIKSYYQRNLTNENFIKFLDEIVNHHGELKITELFLGGLSKIEELGF